MNLTGIGSGTDQLNGHKPITHMLCHALLLVLSVFLSFYLCFALKLDIRDKPNGLRILVRLTGTSPILLQPVDHPLNISCFTLLLSHSPFMKG